MVANKFPDPWYAKSLFFFDPNGNIVEFITRDKVEETVEAAFDGTSFLSVSEIGLPVYDTEKMKENC
jgi:catechol-2,3-dioxygenase